MIHTCYGTVWSWFYIIHGNKTNKRVFHITVTHDHGNLCSPNATFPHPRNRRPYKGIFGQTNHPLPMTWMSQALHLLNSPQNKTLHTNRKNRRPLHPASWLQGTNVMASRRFLNYLCAEIHPFCIPNDFLFTDIQYRWLEKKQQRLKIETDFTLIKLTTRENEWYIPDPSGAMSPRKIIS